MIDYTTYCRIHTLHHEQHMGIRKIARELKLDRKTVALWLSKERYEPRESTKKVSILAPWHERIKQMIHQHNYSAIQVFRFLQDEGYTGGYGTVKNYVRLVRPPQNKAFLCLHFDPGECAQVDWGYAGRVRVGSTRRRMSFFVMVLCYSRMMYVEFTLGETQEQFLACHQHAFEYFGAVPRKIMVDNLKSAVLQHPAHNDVVYHPRYVDFAGHFGFEIRACNVRAPYEKGRVERAVRYVKESFLRGMQLDLFAPILPATKEWLDTVANVREHKSTQQRPIDLFKDEERPAMLPLHPQPYDVGLSRPTSANAQFRVTLDTNRYSVPAEYASKRLVMRVYPDRVLIYHRQKLIAEHVRSFDRHQDLLIPEHQRDLLRQRRNARQQQHLKHFLRLSADSEAYYSAMEQRRLNPMEHLRKIIALCEIYGDDQVGRAIEDACELGAYSSEYIINILEQRNRQLPEAGALHLTRREDLLELELPGPDCSIYDNLEQNNQKDLS